MGKYPVPTDPKYVVHCVATCFGYKDSGDDGVGAFGDHNNNETTVGVSLPIPIIRETIGYDAARVHQHTVCVKYGDTIVKSVRITDAGPGLNGKLIWHHGIGHLLDLTYATCKKLGVEYDANNASYVVDYWILDAGGNPVEVKGLDWPREYI